VVANYASASRQGAAAFGDAGVFVEKYVQRARHIEVQIFGDGEGAVVAFPERECSIQVRRGGGGGVCVCVCGWVWVWVCGCGGGGGGPRRHTLQVCAREL
jgi:hypothetical protein